MSTNTTTAVYAICYTENSEPWGYTIDQGHEHSPTQVFYANEIEAETALRDHLELVQTNHGAYLSWRVQRYELPTALLWTLLAAQ
jgi:hypothetical protein